MFNLCQLQKCFQILEIDSHGVAHSFTLLWIPDITHRIPFSFLRTPYWKSVIPEKYVLDDSIVCGMSIWLGTFAIITITDDHKHIWHWHWRITSIYSTERMGRNYLQNWKNVCFCWNLSNTHISHTLNLNWNSYSANNSIKPCLPVNFRGIESSRSL